MFEIYNRRYLGSKKKLLSFIDEVIKNNTKNVNTFADLFGGTGVVSYYFRNKYDVVVNDILKSNCVSYDAFMGNQKVSIDKLEKILFSFNDDKNTSKGYYYKNFKDTYLSKFNASKVDWVRNEIKTLKKNKRINAREENILLTSLIYAVDKVANTVGHYDAYIKGKRFRNDSKIEFLMPNLKPSKKKANIYNEDVNELAYKIKADVVYLDPPYNSRQYSDAYHFLENLVVDNHPKVTGIAKKMDRQNLKSLYSSASATEAFRELIDRLNCKYILLSYNNTGNKSNARSNAKLNDQDIVEILSKKGEVKIFEKKFGQFSTGKTKKNSNHKERIFFCEVGKRHSKLQLENRRLVQSPLNYTGGKFKLLKDLVPLFPQKIDTFYDTFCGGFNVGANVNSNRVVGIDNSKHLIEILNLIKDTDTDKLIQNIDMIIRKYKLSDTMRNGYCFYGAKSDSGLTKTNKEQFNRLKINYNKEKSPIELLVLLFYAFNNQMRFNSMDEFNSPVGKRDFNLKMRNKLRMFSYKLKRTNASFCKDDFSYLKNIKFNNDDFVYLDPPYLLGQATYNSDWNEKDETDLYKMLDLLDSQGVHFALSNVLEHKGKKNNILCEWLSKNKYAVKNIDINYNNASYNNMNKKNVTREILVTNY